MILKRCPVPALTPHPLRKGAAGIVQRSFSAGKKEFFRRYRDEPLELTITLNTHNGHPPQVMLHTDLHDTGPGDWHDIPFSSTDETVYRLTLNFARCGLYRFRIKYSLDGGTQWFWDRVPHSYVMVDPPAMRTVRLYTLIPSASGSFRDWTALLPGIAAMGFDAIHLLPVSQMGFSDSPYAARNLFDVDARYADASDARPPLDQFEAFVEACRRAGLRLCLDLVLNHVCSDSQIVQARPDWIMPDDAEPDGFKRAGCWHMQSWIRWEDLVPLYHDHPNTFVRHELWDYMKQYAAFWSNYAAYTGGMVRFDNLHSSNNEFVADLSRHLRDRYPDLSILGEYFTDEMTLEKTVPEWGINMLLANSWEHPFVPQLRHYLHYLHTVSGRLRHLCAITTHDTGVPAQLFGSDRSALPRYALCALCTMGQTGMVQGVEAGVRDRIPFIGPTRKLDLPAIPEYRDFFARVNGLLVSSDILRQGGNLRFVDRAHDAIIAAYRGDMKSPGKGLVIMANLDTQHEHSVTLDLADCGLAFPAQARDVFSGELATIPSPSPAFSLPPCGVRIVELA